MTDNPPLNADDELQRYVEAVLMEVFKPYILRDAMYDERQPSGLDQFTVTRKSVTMAADVLAEMLMTDRKKHELQASYSQLLDAYIGLRSAGRELDLIAQAKRDRVVDAIQDRLLELEQELEKL